ncbi:MAG: MBL fold metallo-hydrolase [Chloroflexi bacterium HGW-Chloroflexi-5]|nr:MAG: MBL fold metallo-hydrolase [Chloroflexi bacterium HGW-Chloroflexi-5]
MKNMELMYLGQAGLQIIDHSICIMIDPYLSNYVVTSGIGDAENFNRSFPAPIDPQLVRGIDAVFVTHDHADHTDPDTLLPILINNPQCVVIGPQPSLDHLNAVGVGENQLRLAHALQRESFADFHFTALPSAHYELEQDKETGEYTYLGFVIEIHDKVLYHAGDTILYEGLIETLKMISDHFDVCCLPVNGRDAGREAMGMIGNLHPEESLELAQKINSGVLIPLHNDMFKINSLDPERLNNHAKIHFPNQKVKWMKPGEILTL